MELNSLLFIACYLLLLQSYALSEKTLGKRAITSVANPSKHDEVEGSGIPPSLTERQKNGGAGADMEWEASGISPDDEDGDVVEGSGAHTDEVAGSGNVPVTSTPTHTSNVTRTTTVYSPFDINIHETDRGSDEADVAIEEVPTTTATSITVQSWTTTSRRPPLTPFATEASPPPTVFEEKRNIPFDALLKPGVLAAVIGGIVVGILAAILLVMFVVYRMRKKDEGSYALEEPKQPPRYSYAYQKAPTKEFYA